MRITFYYDSPYRFDDRSYESGVGGSEAAFILLIRALRSLGQDVEVFARPPSGSLGDYRDVSEFDPSGPRDALVLMRFDTGLLDRADAGRKGVWTTHEALDATRLAAADRVVCASAHQRRFLLRACGVEPRKLSVIPYGIWPD